MARIIFLKIKIMQQGKAMPTPRTQLMGEEQHKKLNKRIL